MHSLRISTKRAEYSPGHKFCLQCLKSGCVNTFVEVFYLIRISRRRRKEAELKEERYLPKMLENESSKLKLICRSLMKCEIASKNEDIDTNFEIRMKLGTFFHQKSDNDIWLAEHLYKSCYHMISGLEVTDGRKVIQVMERLACLMETNGNWSGALEMLEEAFKLAEDCGLERTDNVKQSMYLTTYRICMKMGEKALENEEQEIHKINIDKSESLKFFEKALEMAKFTEGEENKAVTHTIIGKIMLLHKNYSAAIKHFNQFMELSNLSGDKMGLCNGYLALSSIYEKLEDKESMLIMLNKCKSIALANDYVEALVPCYIILGQKETKDKNYKAAYEQIKEACEILEENKEKFLNYTEIEQLARVCVGIAKAHLCFGSFTEILSFNSTKALAKLMNWKNIGIGFKLDEEIADEDAEIATTTS